MLLRNNLPFSFHQSDINERFYKYLWESKINSGFPELNLSWYYGLHEDEKFSFLGFFQFLVSRREMGDEKREIDFLHILPNFGQILVLFEDFSKYNQHFRGF